MSENIMKEDTSKQNRVIRIFISSTFRDMHEEREELVKRIFPQLRKLCESRGVVWGEVDLRWGVTDEEKAEGKVLPICLAEIQRCRPYFIGLLGERYGWIPREIPPELKEQESWLGKYSDHSLTELEILHGVLRDPKMADHSFFYFRDPSYIHHLPQGTDKSDYLPENETAKAKLSLLKNKIRQSGLPVRENYSDPRALGQLVLQDLTDVINKLYPEGSQPDPLDRDAADHEAFAQSRARVYLRREEYFKRLDEHAEGDRWPLVILGDSGSGKSALLANWAIRYRQAHPETLLIMHFISASPYSSDWAGMLRRIMGELKRKFGIQQEIPDKVDEIRSAFANWLHMASAKGKVILILDALNQLEDREGAPDLVWLPPVIPPNVRLILSTLPGRPLDNLKKRQWSQLEIQAFTLEERKLYIEKYLSQYTKSLSSTRADKIVAKEQTSNPLYLQALLEELRVFGKHEKLDEWIDHYLEADTIPELYERILIRYEQDYEHERPGLVRDAMSLFWAARRGLTETELLDMLGSDGQPLQRAYWSPFYLSAEHSLVNRSGLIGFSHDYIRHAVWKYFIGLDDAERVIHLRIADYFNNRDINIRKLDELPWQLAQASEFKKLSKLLTDNLFFVKAWLTNSCDVKTYWVQIEHHSKERLIDAYGYALSSPVNEAYLYNLQRLLDDMGYKSEALNLALHLVEYFRANQNRRKYQESLGIYSKVLLDKGDISEAMRSAEEMEHICRDEGYKDGLSVALGLQANALLVQGDLNRAMELYKQQETICRELHDEYGLQSSLHNQANIFSYQGNLEVAMALYKKVEVMCRESGNSIGWLALIVGSQARILKMRGNLREAMVLYRKQELLCRELGDKDGLSRSLDDQADLLEEAGDLDSALAIHKEGERLNRELGNKHSLLHSLGGQANTLRDLGRLDESTILHEEVEQLCRELKDKRSLSYSLLNHANVLRDLGDLNGAMGLFKEQELLCSELDDKYGLSYSLGNQGLIARDRGELDLAMQLYKEQEKLCQRLGNQHGLAMSLINQAELLATCKGNPTEAFPLAEKAYKLALTYGYSFYAEEIQGILERIQIQSQGDANSIKSYTRVNYIYKDKNNSESSDSQS